MTGEPERDEASHGRLTTRPATAADFACVLDLNADWQHFTSPLDLGSLERLHGEAAVHLVAESGGRVVGFALAFREGASYASPNYRWFSGKYERFLYVDRVVVARARHRAGVGSALYREVIAVARRQGLPRVVCEIDAEPPNAASAAFHERFGFVEVGTQWVGDGAKRVSLRCLSLGAG